MKRQIRFIICFNTIVFFCLWRKVDLYGMVLYVNSIHALSKDFSSFLFSRSQNGRGHLLGHSQQFHSRLSDLMEYLLMIVFYCHRGDSIDKGYYMITNAIKVLSYGLKFNRHSGERKSLSFSNYMFLQNQNPTISKYLERNRQEQNFATYGCPKVP